ncbi:MAG: protein-L-isoaspartate(D-aspartate) O-methyltransferase [Thermodesulfobacteriota bacterium]
MKKDIFERARRNMVDTQLIARGVADEEVLDVMGRLPRHLFVDEAFYSQAYSDYPLPIGHDQTISQPYMVAFMTEALKLKKTDRVLEIGTGSGYQSAVLSMLAEKVYSIERISALRERAGKALDGLSCSNVILMVGDGTRGWPDEAPFDAILVAAGAPDVPAALVDQLAIGGRLVIPIGDESIQELYRITRTETELIKETLGACRFVKLIGKYGWVMKENDIG